MLIVPLNALKRWQRFYGGITGDSRTTSISNTSEVSDLYWFITGSLSRILVRHSVTIVDYTGKNLLPLSLTPVKSIQIPVILKPSFTELVLYQTFFILDLYYTELILNQTYFIPNLFITYHILYRTYYIKYRTCFF